MSGPTWVRRLGEHPLPPAAEVGGKAAGVAHMLSLGLPVPPAFVLTVAAGREYLRDGEFPETMPAQVRAELSRVERDLGLVFGDHDRPLLVSVRSGAAVSMPGMMDTLLNVGINDEIEAALAARWGSARFARDTHARFCRMYARVVLGDRTPLDHLDTAAAVRDAVRSSGAGEIPTDPCRQLWDALGAVFESWRSRRAVSYRRHHGIEEDGGTAATVQAMVYGNLDDRSGTGVLFTRDPISGRREPYGEYLAAGQGEDVVSGSTDPRPLADLAERMPEVHAALLAAGRRLEQVARDAQDVEFTVQSGLLVLLQTRTAKRAPAAAIRMAVEMAEEGLITAEEALLRVSPDQVRMATRPSLDQAVTSAARTLRTGVAASPGIAAGVAVAGVADAVERAKAGTDVILVAATTRPEDLEGMLVARGVVTELGGSTSHAAVVCRSLGKPCVVGCGEGAAESLVGRQVTMDGSAGVIYDGVLPTHTPVDTGPLSTLVSLARTRAAVGVVAETPSTVVPENVLNLDETFPDGDPEEIFELCKGVECVSGTVFGREDAIAAAARAGVRWVVATDLAATWLAAAAVTVRQRTTRVLDRHGGVDGA